MTVSIGSNTKLNSIAGVAKVLQLTNSEKVSLANKVLPSNILVRDDAGVLYMTDGVHPVSALSPAVPTKVSDLTNDSGFISAHPAVSTLSDTTSTGTPAHGGSFDVVDGVTRDSFGHVTKINVKTVTLPADNNTDTLVNQNVSSANNTYPILLTPTANAAANQGAKTAIFASGVKVNPSTNTISATFSGNLTGNVTGDCSGSSGSCSGNASTATQFSSNASVTLTGDVTGTASSKKGWSVAATLADSGVTQGTYGPSANVTGSNGATISVPEITVDSKGRITSIVNHTYTSVDNNTTYSAMTDSEATTGTATTARSISAKVLHDKITAMIPDNVTAITSAEIAELLAQKLSPTPTRDGAMWMDSNYTMFVNEYNRT